ncbi:MAG: hypothetical protein CMN30_12805 [Sandaracinus sp.]|nr:hypothetical protein [Sandaracinus sp.]
MLRTTIALLATLLLSAGVRAQAEPLDPPPENVIPDPGYVPGPPAVVADEGREEPAPLPLGLLRLRFSLGATLPAVDTDPRTTTQLERLGFGDTQDSVVTLGVQIDREVTSWLRLGGLVSALFTGSHSADAVADRRASETALRMGTVEAVAVLGSHHRFARLNLDYGVRLTGGGGIASWRYDDGKDLAAMWRATAGLDLALLFGRNPRAGVGLRGGIAAVRTGAFGPLDLRFGFVGPFVEVGLTLGF